MIGRLLASTLLIGVALPALAEEPASAPTADASSGQDPIRPVTRLDLRLKLQDNPGGVDQQTAILRADTPFGLGDGWALNTRVDLPFVRTNAVAPPDAAGGFSTGLGDLLIQGLLVTPPKGRWQFAVGTQLIAPTGSARPFTSGRWQVVPSAAAVYQLPTLGRGSFVGLVLRDAVSFAGRDDRAKINVVTAEPVFNWQLRDRWFLTLSSESKLDARNDWKLFLPLSVTVGRKVPPRTVVSLEAEFPLVDDYKQYDWRMELRIGKFL